MVYERASFLLGSPYVLNGFDPSGWDCRGLVSWCRREWNGRLSPGMDGFFPAEEATDVDQVQELMLAQVHAWEQTEPQLGAVALFTVRQRIAHVGYMLNDHEFLHAREGYGTTTNSLYDKKWQRRFKGAYELR